MKRSYKIVLGVIISIIIISLFSLNYFVKGVLVDTVNSKTKFNVSIGKLWINPFTGNISSKKIEVKEKDKTLFTLKAFKLDTSLLPLLSGRLNIDEISLVEPTIDLENLKGNKPVTNKNPQTTESVEKIDVAKVQTVVQKDSVEAINEEKSSFIKAITVKGVKIERLTLKSKKGSLKSLNQINLVLPKFQAIDNKVDANLSITVVDSGTLNTKLSADIKSGEFTLDITSKDFKLHNSATTTLGELVANGTIGIDLNIAGNYLTKEVKVSGNGGIDNLNIVDSNKSPVLALDSFKYNLENVMYTDNNKSYQVGGRFAISHLMIDTPTISGGGDIDLTLSPLNNAILVKDLNIKNGRGSYQGNTIEKLNLNIKDVSTLKIDSPLKVSGTIDSAPFSGDLYIKLDDLKKPDLVNFKGKLNLERFNLLSIKSYLKDIPYEVKGIVSYNGDLFYSKDLIKASGRVVGEDIDIKDNKGISMNLTSSDINFNAEIKGKEATLNNTRVTFEDFKATPMKDTKVSILKGTINLKNYSSKDIVFNSIDIDYPNLLTTVKSVPKKTTSTSSSAKDAKTPKTTKATPAPKKAVKPKESKDITPLPNVTIGILNITNGSVTQVKDGIPLTLEDIKIYSKNFTTRKNKDFYVDLSAAMKSIQALSGKGDIKLYEDYNFDPKKIKFNGSFGVKNLNLPDFNELMKDSVPNVIENGSFSLDGKVDLDKGILKSNSNITLSKIKVGKETGIESKIPLDRVLDALEDKNGDIHLEAPINGDLNDPKFDTKKVIMDILFTNFKNILKSPEKAVSTFLGSKDGKSEDTVYYDYLETKPNYSDMEKLDGLIKVLQENPSFKARITLFTNDKVEEGLIKTKNIAGALFGSRKTPSKSFDKIVNDRKAYLISYLSKSIDSSRIEVIISTKDKNLPQGKIEILN